MPVIASVPSLADVNSTGNLPGFNEIMSEIGLPCSRCHRIPVHANGYHQCCPTGGEQPHPSTGYKHASAHDGSAACEGYLTNIDSAVSTPISSRSPSISGSGDALSSDYDDPTSCLCPTCGHNCRNPDHVKKEAKKDKEKRSRFEHAQTLQNDEDLFSCHFDWKPTNPQSAGNGNAAGVETPKIDLMRLSFFYSRLYLQRGLQEAIAADREKAWQEEMHREAADFLRKWQSTDERGRRPAGGTHAPYDPSFDGSWMELPDKRRPCRPVDGKDSAKKQPSRLCRTHPESRLNYIECRKKRRQAAFLERKAQFTAARKGLGA